MKRVFSILMLLFLALHAYPEIVKGRVVDAQTKEPLEGANIQNQVEIDLGERGKAIVNMGATTDEKGIFTFRSEWMKNEMTISYLGYYEKKMRIACAEGKDTLYLKDIELEPTEFMLKTLQVTGHAKRFTMRGDTVVFNPEGFHLEQGDRLETLIAKLPGVSNENGKLSWNGKPIRLRMNGNDAFSESMLGQLPVEAVQDIKAYDKKSELEERTGTDDGEEDRVLDVTIKKSFLDKWYGSANLQGYSSGNYSAQLTGNFLSEHNPLMAILRAADDNMSLEPYAFGGGMVGSSGILYRQQLGTFGYQHSWKPKFESSRNDDKWDIMTFVDHEDGRQYEHTTLETFLDGMAPTLQVSSQSDYEHKLNAPLRFSTYRNLSPNTILNVDLSASIAKRRVNHTDNQETGLLEALGNQMVNKSFTQSLQDEKSKSVRAASQLTHIFGKNSLMLILGLNYDDKDSQSHEQADYDFFQSATRHETDIQDFHTQTKNLLGNANMNMRINLSQQLQASVNYDMNYSHKRIQDDRMRNGAADFANTMDETYTGLEQMPSVGLTWNVGKLTINPEFTLDLMHEKMDYQRGKLDTLATRNLVLPQAWFSVQFKPNRYHRLNLDIDYRSNPTDILQTLAMKDDTNPLMVIEGNPFLKNSKRFSNSLVYNYIQPKHDQSLSLTLSYSKDFDPVQQVGYYNPETGAYRMHQENTKGGDSWSFRTNYSRALNDDWQWDNVLNASLSDSYGVLTIIEGKNERTLTQQNYTRLSYGPKFEYSKRKVKMTINPSGNWSHYTYTGDKVEGYDLYGYSLNTNFLYTIGLFKLGFAPSFKGKKGYNNSRFNRDYLVINGGVTYEPTKYLTLTLDVNDLFNKDQRYYNSETSTTRSERMPTNFHHYAMFQCIYKFDAKEKKPKSRTSSGPIVL